ncbi:MAG TPA: hypothetical protein PKA88_13740, partial [Polyangiaceae bacterium]|nr:hypothetical protein [Polyangiaceae bacterium]
MNDSTRRLRLQLLTAIATTGLMTTACGGSTKNDSAGGTGGQGASGAVSGSGGTNTGGFGATSTGGVGAYGGYAGEGGYGGYAGEGGYGGYAGEGGYAGQGGGGGYGPFTKGTVDCNGCGTPEWTTCWAHGHVPTYAGTPPKPGCPDGYNIPMEANPICQTQGWQQLHYYQPVLSNGFCCYKTSTLCVGGRPFKVDGELRVASVCERDGWCCTLETKTVHVDAVTEKALAQAWLADAQLEHASVAAFARLSLQLMALGAPAEFVRRSQAASIDEIRHAENCFALASRHANTKLGPDTLSLDGILGAVNLETLVRETFEEGCIGETLAAMQAAEGARVAGDETARGVLSAIEMEESQHAALAFRIVRWALGGDSSLKNVVLEELEKARVR